MNAPANNNAPRPLRAIAHDIILHAEATREDRPDLLGQLIRDVWGQGSPYSMKERQS